MWTTAISVISGSSLHGPLSTVSGHSALIFYYSQTADDLQYIIWGCGYRSILRIRIFPVPSTLMLFSPLLVGSLLATSWLEPSLFSGAQLQLLFKCEAHLPRLLWCRDVPTSYRFHFNMRLGNGDIVRFLVILFVRSRQDTICLQAKSTSCSSFILLDVISVRGWPFSDLSFPVPLSPCPCIASARNLANNKLTGTLPSQWSTMASMSYMCDLPNYY